MVLPKAVDAFTVLAEGLGRQASDEHRHRPTRRVDPRLQAVGASRRRALRQLECTVIVGSGIKTRLFKTNTSC